MTQPLLSIITVNYCSAHRIAALVESLKKYPPNIEWELIIVDNFSNEDQLEKLRSIISKTKSPSSPPFSKGEEIIMMNNIHLVTLHKNYGFGKANNEGVKFAQGEYLAIVNPDTEVKPGVFESLIEGLDNVNQAGMVVPVLETSNGEILDSVRTFPRVTDLINRRLSGTRWGEEPKDVREIEWAQGSFWVLKKDLYEALGGFDERFFLFFEDTDFCRRLQIRNKEKGIGNKGSKSRKKALAPLRKGESPFAKAMEDSSRETEDSSAPSKHKNLRILQIPTARAIHSPNRLSGGNLFLALFRKTFWIHVVSAVKYFWKWR